MEYVHFIIYCGAVAVIRTIGCKTTPAYKKILVHQDRKPAWMKRLEHNIQQLRKELGVLTAFQKENVSRRVINKVQRLISPIRVQELTTEDLIKIIDRRCQKLSAYSNRLRRYKKSQHRKDQNRCFNSDQNGFYRQLKQSESPTSEDIPTKEAVEEYWANIWENPQQHNVNAEWLQKERDWAQNVHPMQCSDITTEELKHAVNKVCNWKSPGPDNLHNYWLKKFTCAHVVLAQCFTTLLQKPEQMPNFMISGTSAAQRFGYFQPR